MQTLLTNPSCSSRPIVAFLARCSKSHLQSFLDLLHLRLQYIVHPGPIELHHSRIVRLPGNIRPKVFLCDLPSHQVPGAIPSGAGCWSTSPTTAESSRGPPSSDWRRSSPYRAPFSPSSSHLIIGHPLLGTDEAKGQWQPCFPGPGRSRPSSRPIQQGPTKSTERTWADR